MNPARFQETFVAALRGTLDGDAAMRAVLLAQPGLAVYRNTVMKAKVDAIAANYPTVEHLVGGDWLRAAAVRFVTAAPPDDARLFCYGAGFADFLADFAPAAGLPYLPAVAAIDRLWTLSHVAADAPVLSAAQLAACPADLLGQLQLVPHPATQWRWCDAVPAPTVWQRHRPTADASSGAALPGPDDERVDAQTGAELAWRGEGIVLTRAHGPVVARITGPGACALLDACRDGAPLGAAAAAASAIDADLNLSSTFAALIAAGAFSAAHLHADFQGAAP